MQISQSERDAVYKTIFARRDVRGEVLHEALGIPTQIVPIAYLCLGYVSAFHDRPELASAGWLPRLDLQTLIHHDAWGSGV